MKVVIKTRMKDSTEPFFEVRSYTGEPIFVFNVDPISNFEFSKRTNTSSMENTMLDFCISTGREENYMFEELEKDTTIYISPYDSKIVDYLNHNEELQNKKIVFLGKYSVSDNDNLQDFLKKFKKYEDRVYVDLEGNEEPVLLVTACRTTEKINEMAEHIKKLDLSPMEQVMYAYDMVRSRIYKKEGKKQNPSTSRDLSKVLFGDRIVCAGYSQVFMAIIKKLGMNSNYIDMMPTKEKNNGNGHERNIVYINDPKYGIDGVYYFDTTWDRKREPYDKDYLYKYRFFGLNQREEDASELISKHEKSFTYKDLDIEKIKENLKIYFNAHGVEKLLLSVDQDKLNKLSKKFYNKKLLPIGMYNYNERSQKYVLTKIENMITKFNSPLIDKNVMERLILNVKKIEYKNDQELCPYDISNAKFYSTNKGCHYLITPEFIDFHKEEIENIDELLGEELSDKLKSFTPIEKYIYLLDEETKKKDRNSIYEESIELDTNSKIR